MKFYDIRMAKNVSGTKKVFITKHETFHLKELILYVFGSFSVTEKSGTEYICKTLVFSFASCGKRKIIRL